MPETSLTVWKTKLQHLRRAWQPWRRRSGGGTGRLVGRTFALYLGLVTLGVSACGFEPVYAPGGGAVAEALRTVSIDQPAGRIGQAMRLAILDGIGDRETGIRPRYRLRSQMKVTNERVAIQADESAARINVTVDVSWQLQDAAGLETLERGQVRRTVAYNIVADTFASLVGQRDAERLAGQQVGEAIRTRLLLAFRDR